MIDALKTRSKASMKVCAGQFTLVTGVLLSPMLSNGQNVSWEEPEIGGKLAFVSMENAPFPHESRKEGHQYRDEIYSFEDHYNDSTVAVYIPEHYKYDGNVDLLYYFHGWGNNVRKAIVDFELLEQVSNSKKNVIFVFPEGPVDASDSSLGKLEDPDGLKALTSDVLGFLNAQDEIPSQELGDVYLSGHSGAYRGIAFSLRHGGLNDHLKGVYLLDASYANLDDFTNWVITQKQGHFRSIFTDHLAADNASMMATLTRSSIPFKIIHDQDMNEEVLGDERVLFIYTSQRDHNQAVEVLEAFLASSP